MSKPPLFLPQQGFRNTGATWSIAQSEVYLGEHQLASAIVERWAMVACVPEGEDSAGRQKLRLATNEELVSRGVAVAELLFATSKAKGWAIDIPAPEEAQAALDKHASTKE